MMDATSSQDADAFTAGYEAGAASVANWIAEAIDAVPVVAHDGVNLAALVALRDRCAGIAYSAGKQGTHA